MTIDSRTYTDPDGQLAEWVGRFLDRDPDPETVGYHHADGRTTVRVTNGLHAALVRAGWRRG